MEDDDFRDVEAIYDALDAGDGLRSLALARAALAEQPDDPVLHCLTGEALLEMQRPDEAVEPLRRAVAGDPEDTWYPIQLALALFRCCRFDEAEKLVERVIERAPDQPFGHYLRALLSERRQDFDGADRSFAEAARLDPESFAVPTRLDRAEFDAEVQRARARLPERFQQQLNDVTVIVDDLPPEPLLTEEQPALDPELYGLFVGLTAGERAGPFSSGDLPPRIFLFRRNLERQVAPEALAEEIATTLYHELGHYLGMDEDDLEQAGFA